MTTETRHIIGIADMQVSNRPGDILTTYSLGSCLGLTLYDPIARVGGMVHCMLPLSKADPDKAKAQPLMYTDTGVMSLINAVYAKGARRKSLIAKVAGCSRIFDTNGHFRIGERNHTICRKLLWKNGILIDKEDVGGSIPRTLSLFVDTGRITVKTPDGESDL